MPNSYELAGREKKIGRLLVALDAMLGHTATADDARRLTEAQTAEWLRRADCVGSKWPSDETIAELAERLKARDEHRRMYA